MGVRNAINKAKANQKVTPKDLVGNDKKAYDSWVEAFASGELMLRSSLTAAVEWLLENTALTCCTYYVKECIRDSVRKVQNEREEGDKKRTAKSRTNATRRSKRAS
jgi:hypothetical protein